MKCKLCGKDIDLEKDDFVLVVDEHNYNFWHTNCFEKNRENGKKEAVKEALDEILPNLED